MVFKTFIETVVSKITSSIKNANRTSQQRRILKFGTRMSLVKKLQRPQIEYHIIYIQQIQYYYTISLFSYQSLRFDNTIIITMTVPLRRAIVQYRQYKMMTSLRSSAGIRIITVILSPETRHEVGIYPQSAYIYIYIHTRGKYKQDI